MASTPTSLTAHEIEQLNEANASGHTPVVFIHGLWLLPSSWERWALIFADAGFAPVLPGWPDDAETVAEANAHPEAFAHKSVGQVADHFAAVIRGLAKKPAVVGHSFGGLLTRSSPVVAGARLGGGRSGAVSRRLALADLGPALGLARARQPRESQRAVPLTYEQFRYAFANAVSEDEAKELYATFAVPAAGLPIFKPPRQPQPVDRGQGRYAQSRSRAAPDPLRRRITVPWAIANASTNARSETPPSPRSSRCPMRHSLTIDAGWREVRSGRWRSSSASRQGERRRIGDRREGVILGVVYVLVTPQRVAHRRVTCTLVKPAAKNQ